MAQQQKMQMPGVFGGLMRYDDEFKSRFMVSPAAIVGFIIAIIVFVLILKIFFPVSIPGLGSTEGNLPTGHGGFFISFSKFFGV